MVYMYFPFNMQYREVFVVVRIQRSVIDILSEPQAIYWRKINLQGHWALHTQDPYKII